ncbi:hypothetical protein BVG16_17845 [Paenibacillus selenitireducens]|uniref:Glycosyl transferase family 1 n=1 Tax=Paenibacillus selenitireducens TaxID=1324314 RepID=A0A1T2X8A2_9BACL|nr:glycosyltransferase family 4 protein [Paenibacillus selenitireducens]OPA76080.1 hypothetical protein BVG16_17845 [Paenibacillus selenitireducens]
MNICLVSRELYPFQKAGIGVYIHNLSESLALNGHHVFIITSKENQTEYALSERKVEPCITILGVDISLESQYLEYNFAYSLSVFHTLDRLVEEVNIDIVEFADYFGESFFSVLNKKVKGNFSDIPFVMKLHTPTYECNIFNRLEEPSNIITQQEDYTIRHIDYIYAISGFLKNVIQYRLNRSNIQVVYNMIKNPPKTDFTADTNLKDCGKYVLYVGRLEERKGIDLFVKAAVEYLQKNSTEVKFIIVGKDIANLRSNRMVKDELMELIPSTLHSFFEWKNPIPQEYLIDYYKKALVSIFPSRFEGFGNVCVEAMAMGSPVIVSDNTAMIEIIEAGKYGVSFKNNDEYDLYEKLVQVLQDEDKQKRLSQLSKERAAFFSPSNLYPKQIQYYSDVIEHYKTYKQQDTESIVEDALLRNIDKVQVFYSEIQRLTTSWEQLAKNNQEYIDEIKKLDQECKRVLGEWKGGVHTIEFLNREIKKRDFENKRILDEWQKVIEQKNNSMLKIEMLLQDGLNSQHVIALKNKDIEGQNSKIASLQSQLEQISLQLERKTIELDEVHQQLQSKKFLLRRLLTRMRGK